MHEEQAEDDVEAIHHQHDDEGRAGVACTAQCGIDGKHHAGENGYPAARVHVAQGYLAGKVAQVQYFRYQEIRRAVHEQGRKNAGEKPQHARLVGCIVGIAELAGTRHAAHDGGGTHAYSTLHHKAQPHHEGSHADARGNLGGFLAVVAHVGGQNQRGGSADEAHDLLQQRPERNGHNLAGQTHACQLSAQLPFRQSHAYLTFSAVTCTHG